MHIKKWVFALGIFPLLFNTAKAQQTAPQDELGILNVVTTAVPFLRVIPDSRSGGIGDAGVAISPDVNALFHNPSKIVFIDDADFGIGINYTPWLRSLVNDVYLANIAGYYKLDDMQALGLSLRYFSLGNIQFTDAQGANLNEFRPNEFALDGTYSRRLSDRFSTGITLRFIYSNLASGYESMGEVITAATAASGDISFFYTNDEVEVGDMNTTLNIGANISNLGSKISYTQSAEKDFLPANLGIGVAWELNLDDYNQLTLITDFNKLLAPTPQPDGSHRELSVPAGIFGSFSDAPGGFTEEMREIMFAVGLEYWYDQQFAVRVGYFNEHELKGNRKFLSAGLGVRYNVLELNFSYLIPTTPQPHPLDNTLRFSLLFNFAGDRS
ncbi:MAG: hypothetical protein EA412_11835 [Chitinophagaceae bacterium]|nr:MAG: hypothetical protein EA412_11835 [Chitinophagaceae bacterium]